LKELTEQILRGLLLAAGAMSLSCTTGPSDDGQGGVRPEWVTPDVAASLTPAGQFTDLWREAEFGFEITASGAAEIGMVFVKTLGPSLRSSLEEDHEGPIDFNSLHLCGRHVFLHSSFEPLGNSDLERQLHAATSGQWLQVFCSPSESPVLVQTVPARTLVTVLNGQLVIPPGFSSGITPFGVPISRPQPFQGPEKAVELVYAATGQRIGGIPQPVHDIFTVAATPVDPLRTTGVFWKVRVEHPVAYWNSVTETQGQTDQFWVVLGYAAIPRGEVYVAAREPPPPVWHQIPLLGDSVLLVPREPLALIPFAPR